MFQVQFVIGTDPRMRPPFDALLIPHSAPVHSTSKWGTCVAGAKQETLSLPPLVRYVRYTE